MKANYWKWVERGIYIFTLIIMVLFWMRDEAKEDAVIETDMKNLADDVSDINKKLDRNEEYWQNQNRINGRVITYIDIDSK